MSHVPDLPPEAEERKVTTLELFFDLVFVFAITQLTELLVEDPTPRGVLEVLLIFGVLWWMFGGYVWLTNAVTPDRALRRLFLLSGMIGFMVVALALPTAFHGNGVIFGIGYLGVVLVHAGLFAYGSGRPTGILSIAPLNLVAALLVLVAGFGGGTIAYLLWGGAFAMMIATSFLGRRRPFHIHPGHFVERHGLLLIVVLGESVVAIGVGAAGLPVDASLIGVGALALAIISGLWWVYFAGDDALAEEALLATPVERRPGLALNAFFYAQIPMLLGIVAFAGGVKHAIAHAFEPLGPEAALMLGLGICLFLTGDALFRSFIGAPGAAGRALAAVGALLTLPLGLALSAIVQLIGLLVVVVGTVLVGARSTVPDTELARTS